MPDPSRIPDELKQRLERQRKRHKLVRTTFPLTIVVAIVLMFVMHQVSDFAPVSRVVVGVPDGQATWVLDQQFELAAQQPAGSFGLIRHDGDDTVIGPRNAGVANSITLLPNNRAGVISGQRFLEYDLGAEGWPRVGITPLGISDPGANAVAAYMNGNIWMAYARGTEVFVQPVGRPGVVPRSLHKSSAPRPVLGLRAAGDRLWLSVREARSGDMSLIAFKPEVHGYPMQTVDVDKDDPDYVLEYPLPADAPATRSEFEPFTSITVLQRIDVATGIRNSIFTVLPGADNDGHRGDIPVVSFNRKDETSWNLKAWHPDKREWTTLETPKRETRPSRLETGSFLTIAARNGRLMAFFNDGRDVKFTEAEFNRDELAWAAPRVLKLEDTRGTTALYLVMGLLLTTLMLGASQAAWMLLNRERPGDRALLQMMDNTREGPKSKEKPDPKVYASALSRGFALLLDIAITSPIIILLQDVYGYEWLDAYGFLAIGSITPLGSALLVTLHATLVTLLVLVIYCTAAEMIWGKTFGKALFRLRVVDAENERPAAWRIVVRNALKVVELIHWMVLILPMVLMMLTGKQQRLGDLLAGTYVVVDVVPEETPDDLDI